MQLKICAGFLVMLTSLTSQVAQAKIVPGEGPPGPPAPHSTAYCMHSTMTADEYMRMVLAIVDHGDLTDITFLEKTLGTNFTTNNGWKEDGTPDPQTFIYKANSVLGNPINAEIIVYSKAKQSKANSKKLPLGACKATSLATAYTFL